ncbi:MAG: DUF4236 domain-containing protein [Firmicutes bacterium]|jgi:hypothetical protein|nr:DUF4236 domain-containing protein [Bacillota bacterium]
MGLRFRKSIRLGKGLRINLSKSGVGFSWGIPGFRITRTAKGRTRKTISIPGTGLSYVKESRSKKKRKS